MRISAPFVSVSVATSFLLALAVSEAEAQTPNLQGIWQAVNTAAWDIEDHSGSLGIPAGQGVVDGGAIPYQPWALLQKQENFTNRATADPLASCAMPGVPRITYMPYPFQILQFDDRILILY